MSQSIQTLIDESKNVVFVKVDLDYQDNSTLIELLPNLVNQDSMSDVNDNFVIFGKELSVSSKKLSIDALKGK